MPTNRTFRENPDLNQLRRQAKEILEAFVRNEPSAIAEVTSNYQNADAATFALHDAQLVLARVHGFESWPKLKAHVNGLNVLRLAHLVREGNLEETRRMLHSRPELANMQMSYGDEHRPLHFAVMARSPSIVQLLMEHGADARAGIHPHRDATTAFALAEDRGFTEIVAIIESQEQLRRESASTTCPDVSTQQDELTRAILGRHEAGALSLLEQNPGFIHASDREGYRPVHAAAAVRSPRMIEWLLSRGADPNAPDKDGRTALDLVATSRQPIDRPRLERAVALLLNAGAVMTAAAAVALGELDWLMARHAQGNFANFIRWESGGLLTVAVRHNQRAALELLLDFGFDPNEAITSGEGAALARSQAYPLWHAAAEGRTDLAELLITRGASINEHVDSSGSPVYSALSHRQPQMVDLLLRRGGIVTADIAAIYRKVDIAQELLRAETNGTKVAEELLEFACSGGSPEIVAMALERIEWPKDDARWFRYLARCADFWNHIPWLYSAARELPRDTYLHCLKLLLDRCSPNIVGSFGRTALHEAAVLGDHVTGKEAADFAKALLDAGAVTNHRDDILKSTPLGWACRAGRIDVARILLDYGAPSVELDAEPWAQPRAWAEKKGRAELLKIL